MTRPAPALSADERARVAEFEAAEYPPEVASILDGATGPGDPRCHSSTPGEFAARWNARTEEERAAHIRWIQEDADVAQRCRREHSRPSPAPDEAEVERAVEAGQVAVRQMAYDWYCPSDERRPRHTCPDCIAEIAVRAALAARVPADDPAAAERRCSATIWPSYANQWIQCPGFIRRGRCSAYGAQHDSPNGISR